METKHPATRLLLKGELGNVMYINKTSILWVILCRYAIGGYDGTQMIPTVEVFEPRVGLWMTLEPMTYARGYAAAVTLGNTICVMGGMQGNEVLDTVNVPLSAAAAAYSVVLLLPSFETFHTFGKNKYNGTSFDHYYLT